MATTNVPTPEFTDAGLLVPTEPELLVGVQEDWVAAFAASGKSLNTELTTPQGQIAQSQAYLLQRLNAALLRLVANMDPSTSSGAFQDALGKIYFITRKPATYGTVVANVGGIAGQVLAPGAQARSTDGSLWESIGEVTFSPSGTATVTFRAMVAGSGPAVGTGGLTIYQRRNGWESVFNPGPSVPGQDVESRQQFEERREESVSIGGNGTAASTRAAVANVPGVTDVFLYNNGSDVAIEYGITDYPIPAHSIAVSVSGGDNMAVAQAIHSKLDCGCGMSDAPGEGTLITEIIEDRVNYAPPFPQYAVRFVRPALTPVYARVVVADLPTLPASYVAQVQQAVADAINNGYVTPGQTIVVARARIGGQIVAANYYPVVSTLGNITPLAITIDFTPDPATGLSLTMGIDQQPTCAPENITVVLGAV